MLFGWLSAAYVVFHSNARDALKITISIVRELADICKSILTKSLSNDPWNDKESGHVLDGSAI